jgi:MFS family permease
MAANTSGVSRSLRGSRNFTALLTAAGISSLGDGVRLAAFPLLAVTITASPVAVTGVAIANRLPWLLVALFSGAIADRYDRRKLMILVDIARAAVVAALAVALLLGADHLVILYIVAVLLGIGETLFSAAAQGLLPEIVPPDRLPTANSQLFTLQMVGSNFLGPMVGSWFFGLNRAVPFVLDAVSFVIGSALLGRVKKDTEVERERSDASLVKEVREGLTWVWRHPLMRSFLIVVTVVNLTQSASQSLLVLLATRDLGMSATAFGVVLAASGVGAFLGGLLSPRIGDRLGVPYVLLPSIAVTCPLFVIIGWTGEPVVLGLALGVNAFLGLLANIQMLSLRQRIVPGALLGRVSSVNMFMSFGFAIPVGALGAGLLAEYTSTRQVYLVCAAVVLVLVVTVAKDMRPAQVKRTIDHLLRPQATPA